MATNFAPTCSLSPPKLYSFNFFPNTAQGCFQEVALLDMQRLGSFTALLVLLVFLLLSFSVLDELLSSHY